MELFELNGFRTSDLIQLNRCRIFLQVNMLSEICNANGTRILDACLDHPNPAF